MIFSVKNKPYFFKESSPTSSSESDLPVVKKTVKEATPEEKKAQADEQERLRVEEELAWNAKYKVTCPQDPLVGLRTSPKIADLLKRTDSDIEILQLIHARLQANLVVKKILHDYTTSELLKTIKFSSQGTITADPKFMVDYRNLMKTRSDLRKSLLLAACFVSLKSNAISNTWQGFNRQMARSSKIIFGWKLRDWNTDSPQEVKNFIPAFYERLNEDGNLINANAETLESLDYLNSLVR